MKTNLRIVGVAGLALVMTCAARGALIPKALSYSYADPSSGDAAVPYGPDTIQVRQFDQWTYGSVQSIKFTLAASITGDFTAHNTDVQDSLVYTLNEQGSVQAKYKGGALVTIVPPALTATAVDSVLYPGGYTVLAGQTVNWNGMNGNASQNTAKSSSWTYWNDYIGTGTQPVAVKVALGIFGAASLVVLVVRSGPVRSRMQVLKGALSRWVDAV